MNKMKKIISIIMSILMLTMTTNISFAAYDDVTKGSQLEEAISFFEDLGIVNGYEDGSFRPEQGMMRADFAILMAGLMGYKGEEYSTQHFEDVSEGSAAFGSVEFLYDKGLVKGTESGLFDPDTPIMFAHAVKMVMSVLGYDYYAEINGGYPNGYFAAASYAKLPSGAGTGTAITKGEACTLLFKAMTAPMMGYESDGSYVQDKTQTLMNKTLKLEKYEGMFVANEELSIFGEYAIEPGYVILDYKRYSTDLKNLTDRVGHYVKYYVDEDDNVISIYDTAKKTITVKGEDINASSTKNAIKYIDGRKNETCNIASDAYFVYNGAAKADMTDDVFDSIYGSVTLIFNDEDKYADAVIIWDYTDYVVSSYSGHTQKLYTSYPSAEFDLSNIECTIKKNDEIIKAEDLKANDIITVAQNTGSIVIKVSSTVVTGIAESEDGDGNIEINGKNYKKADNIKAGYEFGISCEFYLDALGNVFSYKKSGGEKVGYIYNSFYGNPQGDIDEVYSKVFSEDQEFLTLRYAKKVSVQCGDDKSVYAPSALLTKYLRSADDEAIDQIVKYELNTEGQISKIKIPLNVGWEDDWDKDYFKCNMDTAVAKANYDAGNGKTPSLQSEKSNMYNNMLSWLNGDAYDKEYSVRMTDQTKVFTISKREKDWTVKAGASYPNGQSFRNAKVYDISDNAAVGYMLVKDVDAVASSTYDKDDPMILVTNKLTVLNEDEEACPAFVGLNSEGEEKTYYAAESGLETDSLITLYPDAVIEDIEKGDVVQLKVDISNNITGFRILCKADGTPEYYFNPYPTNQGTASFTLSAISHGNAYHGPTDYVNGSYVYKSSKKAIEDFDNGVQTKYPIRRYKFSIEYTALLFNKASKTAEVIPQENGFAADEAFIYEYPGYGRKMIVLYQ